MRTNSRPKGALSFPQSQDYILVVTCPVLLVSTVTLLLPTPVRINRANRLYEQLKWSKHGTGLARLELLQMWSNYRRGRTWLTF